ncbi:hypothetical protein KY290_002278 [Solanum tuberosum]|uniref:Uncharacterized protein n=2 Tax=Solanum tuberosum TaxID=4113 RepID=A0ABQ7WPL3_SOLTU|nr:PREDICTED: uncharacterized protein LOC102590700 [Solanum tuberosum]KAH0733226.1 hypothetical protein KY289_004414 [Solanum tuberosum]KAH0782680.1 hypothetical protein KY290_002278 [Solanum tuberosum]
MQTSQDEMLSQPQQQILEQNDDVSELEEIEEEVNQMAERIAEYRGAISVQLKTTVSSILTAQRPVLGTHFDDGSESQSGSSGDPSSDVEGPIESGNIAILAGDEQKVQLLKQKISENASAIPVVLTRMKECMKRIDKLQSCNGVIHPAFKRKRTY